MLKLPGAKASFASIVSNRRLYVDKTEVLYRLFDEDEQGVYFLSRPRRFGKTLLLSTLEAILRGRRELFKGLWIDGSDYDWTPQPVIRLNLNGLDATSLEAFSTDLAKTVRDTASRNDGLILDVGSPSSTFLSYFNQIYMKYRQPVAVLIDEYDSPITHNLSRPEYAGQIRERLATFFEVLKHMEEFRGFTFITGVVEFEQTSIFSALNNLRDLTLHPDYATICGFTIDEFRTNFKDHMKNLLKKLLNHKTVPLISKISNLENLITDLFDGYSWDGKTKVLNPWSILCTFRDQIIDSYWCKTASISSIISYLAGLNKLDFNILTGKNEITDSLNILQIGPDLNPIPLLFQAGYLTVTKADFSVIPPQYTLGLPNLEVRSALIPSLLSVSPPQQTLATRQQCVSMLKSLISFDAEGFQTSFGGYLANIPHSSHVPSEAFYHSHFLSAMWLADAEIRSEVNVGDGRYDASFSAKDGTLFIFEIKYCPAEKGVPFVKLLENMKKLADVAMNQIQDTNYTKPYDATVTPVCKVALVIGDRTEVMVVFKKPGD